MRTIRMITRVLPTLMALALGVLTYLSMVRPGA
jgi:hypothetical protein